MSILEEIKGGLIVSCQALEDEPLHGSEIMAKMAKAAQIGGATGIRANGSDDIQSIKKEVDLPIIGIEKNMGYDSDIYITPTINEVERIVEAGVDIVAVDATKRKRPNNQSLEEFVQQIKSKFDILLMADISVLEEGINAENAGFDMVGTTLSGYTDYTSDKDGPDFTLLRKLVNNVSIPVVMEGKVSRPEEARKAIKIGAHTVVVGSAITRPRKITARFVNSMQN